MNSNHKEIIIRGSNKEFFPLVGNLFVRFLLYTLVWLMTIGLTVVPAWAAVNYFISK